MKKQKRTKFEMLMDFVEKGRDLKRKDKVEKDKIKQEEKMIERKNEKLIFIVCAISFFIIMITITILVSLGIL